MKLRYTIESLGFCDYIVDFEFHKELDGQIVYDAAFTIISAIEYDPNLGELIHLPNEIDDQIVLKWLSSNEWKIYSAAEREFNV